MAKVNDVFDDVTGSQSFFIPGTEKKKEKFTPFAKGEYLCHIVEAESKVVDVKGGEHKAELFTFNTNGFTESHIPIISARI